MEGITLFISILFIVFGLLQIILFFKVWGMTNDIRAIKNKYLESPKTERQKSSDSDENGISIDDTVIEIKSGRQMVVKEIKEGKYSCYINNGTVCVGSFGFSQIRKV